MGKKIGFTAVSIMEMCSGYTVAACTQIGRERDRSEVKAVHLLWAIEINTGRVHAVRLSPEFKLLVNIPWDAKESIQ